MGVPVSILGIEDRLRSCPAVWGNGMRVPGAPALAKGQHEAAEERAERAERRARGLEAYWGDSK